VKHILPAIRTQPGTGHPGLFTNLAAVHAARVRQPDSDRVKAIVSPKYGDGSEIPTKYLDVLLRVTDETRVLHKWHKGDVVVFDNRIAQHGREPWEGEQEDRRVLAS
jgi:alpha-ketoglutarate-dependent taurine dioxygenase